MTYLNIRGEPDDLTRCAEALRAAIPEGWQEESLPQVLLEATGAGPGGTICVRTGTIGSRSFSLTLVDNHLAFALVSIIPVEERLERELEPSEAGLVIGHVVMSWVGPVLKSEGLTHLRVEVAG